MLRKTALTFVLAAFLTFTLGSAIAVAQPKPVTLEWFSWSIFRLTSPSGKVILTNPFVKNPFSPVTADYFKNVDYIFPATGHGDEMGQAAEIAIKTKAKVLTSFTYARGYFGPRKVPMRQMMRGGPGSTFKTGGMTFRLVGAVHGSTTRDGLSDGTAMGLFVTFENGLTVYFAGSTAVTMDMALWGSRYKPHVAILPVTRNSDPEDIVHMVRLLRTNNPNLKTIIPHHHVTGLKLRASIKGKKREAMTRRFSRGTKPSDVEKALKASGLPVIFLDPKVKQVYELTK